MPRIISLWLPNWPTDRLRRARSKAGALLPEPLVLAVRRGNRLEVGAACGQAQALGIRAGEALATVRARLPGLHVEDLDPAADADALARLARWLQARLSPLVALDPCDGLWLDAAGASHLFGGEERMLERIQARLARDGVKTRVGLADTAGAANALARYAAAPVAIAPVHGASEALAPLPVAALRLPPEDADALARLGIVSVSDLMALPRASVGRRFGIEVLKRLDQALGQAGEPLDYLPHAGKLSARLVLAEPVASSEALHALIDRLVPLLAQKLAQTGTGALRLDLLFRRLDGSVAAVRAGASAPTRDRAHMARLLHMLVEGIDPGFGIEDAVLSCPLSAPLVPEQLGTGPASAGFAEAADMLAARLGPGAVFRAAPRAAAFPEASVGRVSALARERLATWPAHLPRPTCLLDPPERVDAIAMLPDRPPAMFAWRGRRHRVRAADGPERMHAAWWEPGADPGAIRDYFIVEVADGTRLWLYRSGDGEDRASGDFGWRVHGLFGA